MDGQEEEEDAGGRVRRVRTMRCQGSEAIEQVKVKDEEVRVATPRASEVVTSLQRPRGNSSSHRL